MPTPRSARPGVDALEALRDEADGVARGDEPGSSRLGNGSDLSDPRRDRVRGSLTLRAEVAVGGRGRSIERQDAATQPFAEQASDRLRQDVPSAPFWQQPQARWRSRPRRSWWCRARHAAGRRATPSPTHPARISGARPGPPCRVRSSAALSGGARTGIGRLAGGRLRDNGHLGSGWFDGFACDRLLLIEFWWLSWRTSGR